MTGRANYSVNSLRIKLRVLAGRRSELLVEYFSLQFESELAAAISPPLPQVVPRVFQPSVNLPYLNLI